MPITRRGTCFAIAPPQSLRHFINNAPLRWVLTVPFVLSTVGVTALVAYLSYRSGQEAVENLGHQLATETNARVTQELKSHLQTPLLINRLNVDAVNQGQLDLRNVSKLEAALFNRLQQFEQVTAVLSVSPEGRFRAVERLPELYSVATNPPRPDKLIVYRLDSEGRRKQRIPTKHPLDVRDRAWYQQAVTTKKPGWSPISQYGSFKALSLTASQPVYDRITKRLLGVFAVHLRLDDLSEFLARLEISRVGQVMIMDQSGALIATSTREQPYRIEAGIKLRSPFKQQKIYESQDGLTRSLGEHLRDRSNVLRSLDQTQNLEFKYNGESQYVEITPFRDQYGLDWRILTVIPKSYFMGAIQRNTGITALLCVLALGTAILLGVLAANQLTARFTQFNQASRKLAAGDLDQRLPADQQIAELNSLAQTFNQMADQLQQSFDHLQLALAESEEKFTLIFRSSPDPITLVTMPEGRCVEANDSFLTLLGYAHDELIGQRFQDLGVWHNLDDRAHLLQALQQQGYARNLEVPLVTRTEQIKTVLLSAELLEINDQTYALGILRDISDRKCIEDERKRAEAALQQSEARYRAIVEDQTELIVRFSPDTTVLFVNDAYCRYFGLERETIIGKSYSPIIYEADRGRVAQLIQSMRVSNPTLSLENRVVINGEIRWTQWINRLIFDEQGNFIEFQSVGRDITELKQTEAALRKSEANLLQAQRIAHVGSWEFDPVTQTAIWSEELFRIFGLDPSQSEPAYDELIKLVPIEDRDILMAAVDRAIVDRIPYEVEHRIRRSDGTIRYIVSKGQAMLNDQQQVFKLYGTALDITDRKQAEAEIQQLNQQLTHRVDELQTLFNVLPIGVAISEDPECQIARTNPCLSKLLRVPLDENASQSAPAPERPAYRVYRNGQALSSENLPMQYAAIHNVEVRDEVVDIVHPDGTVINLLSYASPLRDDQGKVRGVIGGFVDISDRKQTEEALQESEERFRRAFDDAPIGISLVSSTGQFVKVNTCYCDLLGYSEAELLTLTFQQITHPADLDGDLEGFRKMMAGEIRSYRIEKRYITKQGTTIPVIINAAPIRDQNGDLLYCVGHVQDLRDRLKVERMKDEFISVVSHELRTPLTSIRGALGILGSGVFKDRPEKAQHMLQIAINNSDRLVRLVDDILKLERLESSKVQLVMEHCQVADLMQQAIDSVQALADQSGITLSLTPLSTTLWAAHDAIIQTLTNLLSNAIKFSSIGDTVWLKAETTNSKTEPDPTPHSSLLTPHSILFTIKDQGRGIPQDKLEVIFEQFQQVDISDSGKKGGTGLGLAICKKIVQQHGGQIWAESSLGEGSTFYFALPLKDERN